MRKLFICIVMMLVLGVNNSSAQSKVELRGNTFVPKLTPSKRDTLVTQFQYEDRSGRTYPIVVNKGTGSCYIMKISGKTGKYYRMYMDKEIAMEVCRRLGIEYRVTPRKK